MVATVPVGNGPRKVAVQPGAPPKAAVVAPVEVAVRADDYVFDPAVIRAHAGQPLRLVIENAASTLHNLSIPAAGIDRDVPPHSRVAVDVVAPRTGTLEYVCKFHGPLGQQGRLVPVD